MSKPSLGFPYIRLRRLRQKPFIRELVQEHRLDVKDLIWPLFVVEGNDTKEAIPSMPGAFRYSIDLLLEEAKKAQDCGIPMIALFPRIAAELRDENGSEAINADNLICRSIAEIKKHCPDIGVMCDVALDPYTSHGHDGIIIDEEVDNDASIEVLVNQALVQVAAGCDVLGPSDMMDGRVGAIRSALESENHKNALIMAYSAKYASAFYGPFRDAVGSTSSLQGDKKSYQQNPANDREALREISLDISEGADMVMVKPGLPYLDVIGQIKSEFGMPTFAYQVSGEFSMIKAAAQNGWINEKEVLLESLLALKRAGSDGILTYAALDVAHWLAES